MRADEAYPEILQLSQNSTFGILAVHRVFYSILKERTQVPFRIPVWLLASGLNDPIIIQLGGCLHLNLALSIYDPVPQDAQMHSTVFHEPNLHKGETILMQR